MFIHGRKSKPRDGVITPEGLRRPYSRPGASNRGFDSLDILSGATKELSGRLSRYAEFARARGNS